MVKKCAKKIGLARKWAGIVLDEITSNMNTMPDVAMTAVVAARTN